MTSTEDVQVHIKQIGNRFEVEDFLKQNNWSILKKLITSPEDLQHLFNEFEIIKNQPEKRAKINDQSIQSLETLLIEKYKLATIEETAKQLSHYADVQQGSELTAGEAIRYLIEDSKEDTTKSHPVLGRLHPYLYENLEDQWKKLSNYCRDELKNDFSLLKLALESFILELGESANVPKKVEKYYVSYKNDLTYLEQQKTAPLIHLEKLLRDIQKYKDILYLWNKRETDENANLELINRIAQHKALKRLYDEWLKWSQEQFTWHSADDCCEDDEVIEMFVEYLKGTGLHSKTYCITLALIFDIKLQFYKNNSNHEIVVKEIINPSSNNTVYVLCKGTQFVQLRIDSGPFRLHQERLQKDLLYKKILSDIKLLQQRPEIDKYLHEKLFLNNHSPSTEVSFDVDYSSIFTYFPVDQRSTLKDEFSKLTQEYIGHEGILYFLQNRFACEGNHISCKEMHYIISSILLYWEENRKEKYTFAWLIAAFPQRKWTDELVVLRLENYFKKQLQEKPKWREYLSKIQNKELLVLFSEKLCQSKSLTTDCVETILHLLSNISKGSFDLESRDVSDWPYVLKEPYWLNKLEKLYSMQECDDLSAASYYIRSIENIRGFAWVESLLGLLSLKITSETLDCETITTILYYIHDEIWNFVDSNLNDLNVNNFDEWVIKMQRRHAPIEEERNISQLLELIHCNSNCSERVKTNLPNIERSIIEINRSKYESFTEKDIQSWKTQFKANMGKKKDANELDELQEMLAVIDRAVVLKRGFNLRDTQKLAVLTLLANDRSILAQVSTGEGKSLIVVAAAIMKALFGEKVDIVTSSSVLAKRDAENNNDIFSLFGITVSHNCSEVITNRKQAYSVNQVVYGDLGSFQRDYLLDRFYGKNILGDRDFTNVIVDEVDSMLVDKGNNTLYLSHDIPWMDKLETVYLFIWQLIHRREKIETNSLDDKVKYIEEAVLNDLYGMIRVEDIAKIDVNLNDRDRIGIWSRLVNAKILDERGKLMIESVARQNLSESLKPEFSKYTDRISFLLQTTIERERLILVPNYLRAFVERHLKQWIKSAIIAFHMNPGHNYVVDVDRTGTSSGRYPNIIILDKDTGADQANSQWDEALHQFLQLKHGCKLSMLSLKTVFISNVSYFKLYTRMYGLTGTLGSQTEMDLLREIHDVDFVTIPTSRTKQFREENPIVCCDSEEWINSIRNHALLVTEKKKRSALIICETVKDAEDIYNYFRANEATNVQCYMRDYEEFTVGTSDNKLDQGKVIIATNLAGRGTDIQISDVLRNAGGLHVLLTYLPTNKRIEEQAFGRAGRRGDKGSGQLIVVHSEKCELYVIKNKRDKEEMLRVSTIKSYYYSQIVAEVNCFYKFRDRYQNMRRELNEQQVPQEVQGILMKSCLDKWAFWLDENNEHITFGENKRKDTSFEINLSQLMKSFESLRSERDGYALKTDRWLPWVEGNPAQMIKLGTYLGRYESDFLTNSYDNSLMLLNDVIIREPYFSEAAHYNKAFIIAKKIDWKSTEEKETKKNFKRALQEAAMLFEKHSGIATSAAGLITVMKQRRNKNDSQCEDSEMKQCANKQDSCVDGYEEQKKHIANIYSTLIRSIDDILGHSITPGSLLNGKIDNHSAEYEFNKLLDEGILKKPKIKRENISEAIVRQIAKDYGIPTEKLETFLQKHSVDKMEKGNGCGDAKCREARFGLNEDTFETQLEQDLDLLSREKFWEILIGKNILQDEEIYVIVDKNKQTTEEISKLVHQLEQRKDTEHTIEYKLDQIVLYGENLQSCQDVLMFKKAAFDAVVSREQYNLLEKSKVLSTNKRATVNVTNIDEDLQLFDSISIDDFKVRANIDEQDAKIIISELVEKQILELFTNNQTSKNALAINFDEMPQTQFLSCPLYEPVVKSLLEICFCYRLALQKIKRQVENQKKNERKTPILIELASQVYRSLFFELVDQKVIEQVKVNNSKLVNIIKNEKNEKRLKLYGTLEKLRGNLKNPENLTVGFKPLKKTFGKGNFENKEEMHIFNVNGLDQVLHFERNKLPKNKIFFITAIIDLIAVAKMAIGSITSKSLYYSGLNDLIYATGVWRTQTFSWEHYKHHALRNTLFLSRDVLTRPVSRLSLIGIKLLLPRFESAKNSVETTAPATFSNRKLLETVMNLPSASSTTERHLKTLCNAIEQEFTSIVMKTLEDYNMSHNLEKYIDKLNYPKAWDKINGVIEDVLKESVVSEKYLPIATNIANFVTSGITNGISQLNITENVVQDIGTLCNPTRWIESITNLCEIRTVTNDLLEALKSNIESKFEQLNKQTEDQNTQTQTENNLEANSIELWRRVDEQCNNILNERVGHVVSQHVVTPIQKKCFDKISQHIDSQMNTIS